MDIGGGGGSSWNDRQQLEGRRKGEFGVTADKTYYCRCNISSDFMNQHRMQNFNRRANRKSGYNRIN